MKYQKSSQKLESASDVGLAGYREATSEAILAPRIEKVGKNDHMVKMSLRGKKTQKKCLKAPFSPLRSMRRFCLDCCGGSSQTITYCADVGCSLWYYRLGKRPTAGDELMDTKNFTEGGKLWPKICGDE